MSIPFGAKTWYPLLIFLTVPPCASTALRSSLNSFLIDTEAAESLPGSNTRLCVYFEEEDARPATAQGFRSSVTEPTSVTRYV